MTISEGGGGAAACPASCRVPPSDYLWRCTLPVGHWSAHAGGARSCLVWEDDGTTPNPVAVEVVTASNGEVAPVPRPVQPHMPGPGYPCADCSHPHIAGCLGGVLRDGSDAPCPNAHPAEISDVDFLRMIADGMLEQVSDTPTADEGAQLHAMAWRVRRIAGRLDALRSADDKRVSLPFTQADVSLLRDIADGYSTVLHYDRLDEFRKRLRDVVEGRAPSPSISAEP
jgi:hypothetical protein